MHRRGCQFVGNDSFQYIEMSPAQPAATWALAKFHFLFIFFFFLLITFMSSLGHFGAICTDFSSVKVRQLDLVLKVTFHCMMLQALCIAQFVSLSNKVFAI